MQVRFPTWPQDLTVTDGGLVAIAQPINPVFYYGMPGMTPGFLHMQKPNDS